MSRQSRERGLFGNEAIVIHDSRGSSRKPTGGVRKDFTRCSEDGCKEMAVDRRGNVFFCAEHKEAGD